MAITVAYGIAPFYLQTLYVNESNVAVNPTNVYLSIIEPPAKPGMVGVRTDYTYGVGGYITRPVTGTYRYLLTPRRGVWQWQMYTLLGAFSSSAWRVIKVV